MSWSSQNALVRPCLVVALVLVAGCQDAPSAGQATAPTTTEIAGTASAPSTPFDRVEARRLIDSVYAAWNTLDADAPARFYAKDEDLVFFDPQPPREGYRGWPAFREEIQRNVTGQLRSIDMRVDGDLYQVGRRGDVAWAAFPFRLVAVTNAGARQEIVGRHTIVWERRGGEWLIVHEHPSVPQSAG